jgi:lipopolysaccharide/colanic/teichoic acid biosynthesis glycosyltransferase
MQDLASSQKRKLTAVASARVSSPSRSDPERSVEPVAQRRNERLRLKRWMEFIGATALIVLSRVVAIIVRLDSPGPAFFRRLVRDAETAFEMWFRTMAHGAPTGCTATVLPMVRAVLAMSERGAIDRADSQLRTTRGLRAWAGRPLDELPSCSTSSVAR